MTDFGALDTLLVHLQCFPRSDLEVLSKTGETISSAVETNIYIPSRHLVCGLEVLLCVSVFWEKRALPGAGLYGVPSLND